MVSRTKKLSKNNNLLIFGPRGVGKTTLLQQTFSENKCLWIDLLSEHDERHYGQHPDNLAHHLSIEKYDYVIIDEIQKFPKLLDIVHQQIVRQKNKKPYFILTGSSARKLKRGGGNLLAGRAFHLQIFPFTHIELNKNFDIDQALTFGTLPLIFEYSSADEKNFYLKSYVQTYLKEEVLIEQLVRQVEPFKNFLEIAAQMNGKAINHSKIARECGVSDQTVKTFYEILQDTLVGFYLNSFHRSVRKQQLQAAKFYFFDLGVQRALSRTLTVPLLKHTSLYGLAFEHFFILEFYRLNEYYNKDFKMSYLRTKDDAEIDLVVQRPGEDDVLIEIKSTDKVTEHDTKTLERFCQDWDRPAQALLVSQDRVSKRFAQVEAFHWQKALQEIFKYE